MKIPSEPLLRFLMDTFCISNYRSLTFSDNNNPTFLYILNGDNHGAVLQQFNCKDGCISKYPFNNCIDFNGTECIIDSESNFLDNSKLMLFNSTLLTLEGELHIIQSYTMLSMYHLKWNNKLKQIQILFSLGRMPIISSIKPCKNKIWMICADWPSTVTDGHLCIKEYSTHTKTWIMKTEYTNLGCEFRFIQLHKHHVQFVSIYQQQFLLAFNYISINDQGIYIFDIENKKIRKSSVAFPKTIYGNDKIYVSSLSNNHPKKEVIVKGYIRPEQKILYQFIPLYLIQFISTWYQHEFIQLTIATKFNNKMTSFSINVDAIMTTDT